jgi:uncharacterized membrane protein
MNKTKLKESIKDLAINVAWSAAIIVLLMIYIPYTIMGKGSVGLVILNILLLCYDIFSSIRSWKQINNMLDEI